MVKTTSERLGELRAVKKSFKGFRILLERFEAFGSAFVSNPDCFELFWVVCN